MALYGLGIRLDSSSEFNSLAHLVLNIHFRRNPQVVGLNILCQKIVQCSQH